MSVEQPIFPAIDCYFSLNKSQYVIFMLRLHVTLFLMYIHIS